ncbi:hypothetical protein KCP70_15980 [Salmonella enterica subsp. enterica]|nr:hypothetical protein KCP70_15980 [Salmonella enterica subsp. enterica]
MRYLGFILAIGDHLFRRRRGSPIHRSGIIHRNGISAPRSGGLLRFNVFCSSSSRNQRLPVVCTISRRFEIHHVRQRRHPVRPYTQKNTVAPCGMCLPYLIIAGTRMPPSTGYLYVAGTVSRLRVQLVDFAALHASLECVITGKR